jgi:isopentenyl-diphosphate delta-isomerase
MTATSDRSVIDVVDPESGEPVGTAERGAALREGLAIRTVHLFLFDDEQRLLLQVLGRHRDRHRLLLGSSVAGFPRPGERDEATARRRAAEELGLDGPLRRLGTVRLVDDRSPKFVTLFEGHAGSPTILEPGHVERLEYWPLPELDAELALRPDRFTETFRQVYSWWGERAGRA